MSKINASVTEQQITVSVAEAGISANVSGGFGPSGAAATVAVGTVTTGAPGSSASVVNAGTSSAAVLNFTIPAGATGATGPQGVTGPAGTTTWAGITDKPATFTPSAHQHVAASITDFAAAVIAAAPPTTNASLLTSGTLPDARLSANIARTSDVTAAVNAVVDAAPNALNTLNELAAALNDDANFASTVTTALAGKANTVHGHDGDDVNILTLWGTTTLGAGTPVADFLVYVNDGNLTDARSTIGAASDSHTHGSVTNDGKIGTTSGQIVVTGAGGALTTAATIAASSVSGLASVATVGTFASLTSRPTTLAGYGITDAAASSHAHGNINNAGALAAGTLSPASVGGPCVFDTLTGQVARGAFGTSAGTVCQGNDSRLSDARTPTAHKTSHATGGSDALTPADIGAAAASHTHSAYSEIQNALAEDPPSALADIGAAAYWDYSDDGNPVGTPPGYSVVSAAGGLWDNPSQVHWLSANDGEVTINPDHVAPFRTALGAASLPTSGLTITKTGDWAAQQPVPFFVMAPSQVIAFGDTVTATTGKSIASWTYSESAWASTGGPRISSIAFEDLAAVTGAFSPTNMAALTTMSLPALQYVGGSFNPNAMAALTTLSLPSLQYVVGTFNPNIMAALTTMSLPALRYVGGSFSPNAMAALTTLSAPALEYVGTNVSISVMAALTTLSLPALQFVSGNIVTSSLNALATLSLPLLRNLGGALTLGTPSLTTLSAPALGYIGGNFSATSTALSGVTLPTDGTLKALLGNVSLSGAALTTTSVNNILQALALMDGTNGTTAYGAGRSVDLSGGTSAAPSNLGSTTTAGSNFVCSGTTCTVNWTGHGYATGDVLRISGITTATNANRYAVITVVNANQFTYTITSQTATGAGTATVVKAGNSAKALVTRGVTLTTN